MKLSFKGVTGAASLLAAALGLSLAGPHRAYAAPGALALPALPSDSDLGVTLLSPDPRTPLSGLKPVEISAFYQGSPGNQIVAVELFLDGQKAATKTLDVPETRGVVSFLVDASQVKAGVHRIVVRVTAADQEVKSARSSFLFGGEGSLPLSASGPALPLPTGSATGGGAPTVQLVTPEGGVKVQGLVTLKVQASDPSGKAPYVSLFIDKTFKTLRNYAPYEFEWDTTAYSNGYHTIEAYGYNDAAGVGQAPALRLYVNNPGGETSVRHDLLDGTKSPARAAKKSQTKKQSAKRLGRPLPLRRPDLLTAAAPAPAETPAPRVASALPAHVQSTREVVRGLVRGIGSLHFGTSAFATELSTPFTAETPAAPTAAKPAPAFKPLPDPSGAQLAETLTATARRVSGKAARLQRLSRRDTAALALPNSDLVPPFLAAPHPTVGTAAQVAAYAAPRHSLGVVVKPALKMQMLRLHLPANLGSLLRSAGQTTIIFNRATVKLDRPLSAQNNVLFGPLRQIFEQGGGTLTWQAHSGTVHAKNATKDILLTIGTKEAVVNAKAVTLDGKPYLLMGRTMVPLSFVTAALDADVQYDAATGHLLITSRK